MSLKFRFTLDGSEMSQPPLDWEEFSIRLRYSADVRGFIHEYNSNIGFIGEDFNTLYSKIESGDICDPVDFIVEYSEDSGSNYMELMSGYIVVSEVQFDLKRRICETKVTDLSFTALIFQNRKLDVPTGQTTSKNGVAISAAPYTTVTNRQGETYGQRTLDGFAQNDLLEYVVAYITDNQITVSNEWYDNLTEEYVFVGKAAIVDSFGIPSDQNVKSTFITTFEKAFIDPAKLFNLHFALVYDSGDYVFTVITDAERYSSTTGLTISAFTEFKVKISEEHFYTSVTVGCDENDSYDSTRDIFIGPDVEFELLRFGTPYFDWRTRKLSLSGQCNIDGQTLNLQTSIQYGDINAFYYLSGIALDNSNIATGNTEGNEAVLMQQGNAGGLVSFSGKRFIVVTNGETNYTTLPETYSSNSYNQGTFDDSGLISYQVLNRYNLPNSVFAGSVPDPDFDFYIDIGTSYAVLLADRFEIDTDTDGHIIKFTSDDADNYEDDYKAWSDTYYSWTCRSYPVNVFRFTIDGGLGINVTDDGGNANYTISVWYLVKIRGSEVTALAYQDVHSGETVHTITFDALDFLPYDPGTSVSIVVQMDKTIDYSIVQVTTFMQTTQVDGAGGDLVTYDPDTFKGYEVEIESVVSLSGFLAILHDPRKRIALNLFSDNTRYAWADDITFIPATGKLSGQLITDLNNLNPE